MRKISIIISLLFTALIFFMSSLSGETSGELSGSLSLWVYQSVIEPLGFLHMSFDTFHIIIRKLAHITEYLILGGLWTWAFTVNHFKIWILLLLGLAISTLDETIQIISINRGPSVFDALVYDFCSFALGVFLTKTFFIRKDRRLSK